MILIHSSIVAIILAFLTISLVQGETDAKNCTNTATSRNCWLPNHHLGTNYYKNWPKTGVTREYWLSVENTTISPDGYEVQALTYNGTVPGPTIRANWGDEVVIHVTNNMQNNGTNVHWHGIRQYHTNMYDGTAGLTECPIAPGSTYTYMFRATQYGSSWYHSHYSVQYGLGLWGPLIIDGPASANYDVDLGPIVIADWSHINVFKIVEGDNDNNRASPLDGALVNGTNMYPPCSDSSTDSKCVSEGQRFNATFEKGKKYRLRLINASVQSYFRFVIDDHNFTVIANDWVPVKPYATDNVIFGPGQRYDIVVKANRPADNYWLRGIYLECYSANLSYANNTLGIINYSGVTLDTPNTTSSYTSNTTCPTEQLVEFLTPYVNLNVGAANMTEVIDVTQTTNPLFMMNNSSFLADWLYPTAYQIYQKDDLTYLYNGSYLNWNDTAPRFELDHIYNGTTYVAEDILFMPYKNQWVYMVLDSSVNGWHPIHLHGHDFYVLSQGTGTYSSDVTLNTQNPPRRDTATLFPNGYMVLAWLTDNPGVWILHCHIAWHVSQGFAVQMIERESEILKYYNKKRVSSGCQEWADYIPKETNGQDDSGF